MNEKNIKITKRQHAFKGYASSYNVEILNSFNPELKRKDTEIKNTLIDLLTGLKRLKGEYVRFKNFEKNIKSSSMIYPDFESILVPEDNGK